MEPLDRRPKPHRKLVGIHLPEDLIKELKVRAAIEGTTMSRMAEDAVVTWISANLVEHRESARQIGIDLRPLLERIEASTGRRFPII